MAARVNSMALQQVPLMPDALPLSSQIRLYNEQQIKSEEKQMSTLMTFSQSKHQ